ncbi:MAG: GatB/YqeY domain-containing protein [Thermovirgaceae bacterium]
MQGFEERLQHDLVDAMKRRDRAVVDNIRLIKAALENLKAEKGRTVPIEEEDIIAMLRRLIKQRREAAGQYRSGGAPDRADRELEEAEFIEGYLPEQMSDEEIAAKARKVIIDICAAGPSDIGKIMGKLMPEIGGKADGSRVKSIVAALLKEM